jgi:hypothetical protein
MDKLNGIPVFLGQFINNVDMNIASIETSTFNIIDVDTLDALGTFAFKKLTANNYFIGLNEYVFST